MLVDIGVEVNAQPGRYSNTLQAAPFSDYKKVAQMLVDAGAEVTGQGGGYGILYKRHQGVVMRRWCRCL
jgi:hypothetical protein